MNNNYVPQPLPFYTSETDQTFRKSICKNDHSFFRLYVKGLRDVGAVPPIVTLKIPTFHILRALGGSTSFTLSVHRADNDSVIGSTSSLSHLIETHTNSETVAALPSNNVNITQPADLENTALYFSISDGSNTYYSEAFFVFLVDNPSEEFPNICGDGQCLLRLDYSAGCAVGEQYAANVSMSLIIESSLSRPTYEFEEEGDEDGQGNFNATLRRQRKVWTFEFYAPEWIADALSAAQVFPNRTLSFPDGQFLSKFNDMRVEVDWENASSCFAKITVTIKKDYLVTTACC